MSERKLPKWLRKINLAYQFILIGLTVINSILAALANEGVPIPLEYFTYYSILISALPVFWSKILDASKQYINDLTPNNTMSLPPSTPHSLQSQSDSQSDSV